VGDLQRGVVQPPPRVLRRLFERLGSTYIKLGQFVASSPTIFPAEYVEEMQALLDSAPPVPWPTIRAIIAEDLGMPLESEFSSVNEVPLATASIAQVHRAVHRESGKEVVIKVLKPGVEDLLGVDLQFLEMSAKILQFIDPSLERTSLVDILGDIRVSMMQECDFTSEARNIATFSSYLDQNDLRRIATAPFVYSQLTSKRVLVMEYLEGTQLTDLAAIKSVTAVDPEQVLINALNVWFGSVVDVRCSTFHADLHAGNLLVMDDGRVGFIDFGIVGTIAPSSWQAIQALAASAAVSDFETIAAALATVGATRGDIDVKAFGQDLRQLFNDFESINPASLSDALGNASPTAAAQSADRQVNSLLLRVVAISEGYGVRFPREFGLLLKQILYLDRYTRILAPTLNWVQDDRVDIGST
jgi:aarF domain-containing kinase